jgi:Autographiviridae DNA primase/helicase
MSTKIVERHVPCPNCPSSDAYCVYEDGHGYCFSCEYYKPSKGLDNLNEYTYEYLGWRGITKGSFSSYGAKTKIAGDGSPRAIGFTYPNGSTKVRSLTEKTFYWEGEHKPGLFGVDKFAAGSNKFVVITEGELDACAFHQVLRDIPVVSVQSAGSAAADVGVDRVWLGSFERIYLAFDGDAAGRDATAKVARLFDFNKIYHVRFTRPDRKDATAFVERGEADELATLFWNAKKYLPDSVVSSMADFEKILSEEHPPSIPYPMPSLNRMTYGIRTGETVLITAQEGVGKTELMHAIEHKLLTETTDALAAFYLEEPPKRHLQALAGLSLRRPVHLPDSDVSSDQVLAAFNKLIQRDDRLYLYSHFGSDDPDALLDTIRFLVTTRSVRYVLFDHITMGVSGLSGEDERRALDYLSTRLEMMVKELDFSLIIVSHVNDAGQTRGSRYISKVADIRIDLQRDVVGGSNITSMVISKNRFCGRTGPAGTYTFDPLSYTINQDEGFRDAEPANDNRVQEVKVAA